MLILYACLGSVLITVSAVGICVWILNRDTPHWDVRATNPAYDLWDDERHDWIVRGQTELCVRDVRDEIYLDRELGESRANGDGQYRST
jgi:hypothetical protein